jgi:hypothetical protein
MRTKRYQRYAKKKRTVKQRRSKNKQMKKYKGGTSSTALDNLNKIPTSRYIPYANELPGTFNYPQQAKGQMTMGGGSRMQRRKSIKGIKRKSSMKRSKRYRGGALSSLIPQQVVNSGRGVSGFLMDKFNGYEGNPAQSSYLPYIQPIENISTTELIELY